MPSWGWSLKVLFSLSAPYLLSLCHLWKVREQLQRGSPLDLGKSEIPNEQPTLWCSEATASSRGKGCSVCKSCPGLTKACGKSPCEPSNIDLAAAKFRNKSTFHGSNSKSDEACPLRVWSPMCWVSVSFRACLCWRSLGAKALWNKTRSFSSILVWSQVRSQLVLFGVFITLQASDIGA